MATVPFRPIHVIARDFAKLIGADRARNPNAHFGAIPYLDAMRSLSAVSDNYGADDGKSICLYFLSNTAQLKGDKARELKNELRRAIGLAESKARAPKAKVIPIRNVDVLCTCGWGRLSIPKNTVPHNCPLCGFELGGPA